MRTRLTIVAGLMLLAACGAFLIVSATGQGPSAAPSVMVTFLGYTNDAAAGLFAHFGVTNASPGPVIRHVGFRLQAPATAQGRWMNVSDAWFTNQANLRAGASEVVLVAVPTNLPAWRLSLTVLRDEPIRMMMRSLAAEAHKIGVGRQPSSRSSGYYRVASDVINP